MKIKTKIKANVKSIFWMLVVGILFLMTHQVVFFSGSIAYGATQAQELSIRSSKLQQDLFLLEIKVNNSGSAKADAYLTASKGKYNSGLLAYQRAEYDTASSLFDSCESYMSQAEYSASVRDSKQSAIRSSSLKYESLQKQILTTGTANINNIFNSVKNDYNQMNQFYNQENYTSFDSSYNSFLRNVSNLEQEISRVLKIKAERKSIERRLVRDQNRLHSHRVLRSPRAERFLSEASKLLIQLDAQISAENLSQSEYYIQRCEHALARFADEFKVSLDKYDDIRTMAPRINYDAQNAANANRLAPDERAENHLIELKRRYEDIGRIMGLRQYEQVLHRLESARQSVRKAVIVSNESKSSPSRVKRSYNNLKKYLDKIGQALALSSKSLYDYEQQGIFNFYTKLQNNLEDALYDLDEKEYEAGLKKMREVQANAETLYRDLQNIMVIIKKDKLVKAGKQKNFLNRLKMSIKEVSIRLSVCYKTVKSTKLAELKKFYNESIVLFKEAEKYFMDNKYSLCADRVSKAWNETEKFFDFYLNNSGINLRKDLNSVNLTGRAQDNEE